MFLEIYFFYEIFVLILTSIRLQIMQIVLDVTSNMAAVEVGGGPWLNTWKGKTSTPAILRYALSLPIDIEAFFNLVPIFKPPGL